MKTCSNTSFCGIVWTPLCKRHSLFHVFFSFIFGNEGTKTITLKVSIIDKPLRLCLVLQEAVSTGDPEMVQLVLQRRDYLKASTALGGVPELLAKIREVCFVQCSLVSVPEYVYCSWQ